MEGIPHLPVCDLGLEDQALPGGSHRVSDGEALSALGRSTGRLDWAGGGGVWAALDRVCPQPPGARAWNSQAAVGTRADSAARGRLGLPGAAQHWLVMPGQGRGEQSLPTARGGEGQPCHSM